MARIVDPVTGGLSFECREDLSPEFDMEIPTCFKWGFDLPKEVDFHVVLGEHTDTESFRVVARYMKDGVDLYLAEGIVDSPLMEGSLLELASGDDTNLNIYVEHILSQNNFSHSGYMIAELKAILETRTHTARLDPPKGHRIHKKSVEWYLNGDISDMTAFIGLMNELSVERDVWALNNLKRVVDTNIPYHEGVRRKVLIGRGFMHLQLLRALEYSSALKESETGGTRVVSSVASLPNQWYVASQKRLVGILN